jgi:predicted PurR-regulated permease PerM
MELTAAQRQTLGWLLIAVLSLVSLWLLAPVLSPFLVAAVLAYELHPAVEWLWRRRVPRVVAVTLVVLAALLGSLALALLVVPILSKELPLLKQQIPSLADTLNQHLTPWLAQWGVTVTLDVDSIKAFVLKYFDANFEDWLGTAINSARAGGGILLSVVGNVVLVPVVLFYLLMDWAGMMRRLKDLVPPRLRQPVDGFLDECDSVLGQYLRGQLVVMLTLAAYYAIALAVGGFDLAVPVGVFTGLAVFIPYLGFGLGLVLALMAGLLQYGALYGLIVVAIVYGLGQLLESMVLTPRLVGERIGLNPLAVIFALLAFGHLFGFVGVLVALPVSALMLVAGRRLKTAYIESRLYQG